MGWFWNTQADKEKEEKAKEEKEKNIEVAVRFLSNPKVTEIPESQKKQFLKKKGLSDQDIEEAYKRKEAKKEVKEEIKQMLENNKAINNNNNNNNIENNNKNIGIIEQQKGEEKQKSFDEICEMGKKTKLISIRNMQIEIIDDKVWEVKELEVLIMSHNKLKVIPSLIMKLSNLKIVQAVDCQLNNEIIEDNGLFSLSNLEQLNLSNNLLTNVDKIVGLTKLKILDLSYNQILNLPTNIDSCAMLQSLNLKNNNISQLPPSIINLKNLQQMFIQNNNLDPNLLQIAQSNGLKGIHSYLNTLY